MSQSYFYQSDFKVNVPAKSSVLKMGWRVFKILLLLFMLLNFFWGLGILFFRTQIASAAIQNADGTKSFLSGTFFEILAGYQADLTFKRHVFHMHQQELYQYTYYGSDSLTKIWEYSNSLFHLCFVYPMSWILVKLSYAMGWSANQLNTNHNLFIIIGSIFLMSLLIRMLVGYNAWSTYKNKDRMELTQQKVAAIKEKFRDQTDFQSKQRMQLEIMNLYRKQNISPGASSMQALMFTPFLFAIFIVVRTTRMIKDSGTAAFSLNQTIWDSLQAARWIVLIPVGIYLLLFILENFVIDRWLRSPRTTVVLNPKKTSKTREFMFKWVFKIMFLVFFFIVPTGTSVYWIFSSAFEVGQKIMFFYLFRWLKKRDALIKKGIWTSWTTKFAFFKKTK